MTTQNRSSARGVIAIGASAGGIDAIQRVIRELPKALEAAICLVLHIPSSSPSLLPQIVARQTDLPVAQANAGDLLRAGHIYVAPPNQHLVVRHGHVWLERGPKENGVRPAIDPLFRSVAAAYGPRGIAVVLSGSLSDGAAGAADVAAAGGAVIVQAPDDAIVPSMPEATLAAVPAAQTCPAVALAQELVRRSTALPNADLEEVLVPANDSSSTVNGGSERMQGPPTGLTCPECHGPLWEARTGELVRYRCRVGHAFSEDVLVAGKADAVEAALWMALEALEERGELLETVAGRLAARGHEAVAARKLAQARGTAERAELIRGVLTIDDAPVGATEPDAA